MQYKNTQLPITFNYIYFEAAHFKPSLRGKGRESLNTELALYSGYCCVRGFYVCECLLWGQGWGSRVLDDSLTILQLLLASGQNSAGQHAGRGQALQRQHALTLLSASTGIHVLLKVLQYFIFKTFD